MNNKVSFCRKYPVEILLEKKAKQLAFFYEMTLGFFGQIDPESGMSISLPEMDSWVHAFFSDKNVYSDEIEFLKSAADFFQKKADLSVLKLQNSTQKITFKDNQILSEYFHEIRVIVADEPRVYLVTNTNDKPLLLAEDKFSSLQTLCEKLKALKVHSVIDRMTQDEISFVK